MALAYVTRAYFTDTSVYSSPFTVTDAAELDRVLERSERDVDSYLGPWPTDTASNRKLGNLTSNLRSLTSAQLENVREAVCCQALYRIEFGEEKFVHGQYESVNGPDFTTQGKLPRLSPQAQQLLQDAGLVIRTSVLR
jgi:hypothetical protein